MAGTERQRELRRRRHRKAKLEQLERRAKQASASEKSVIAYKLRKLTPGAPTIIDRWGLAE